MTLVATLMILAY